MLDEIRPLRPHRSTLTRVAAGLGLVAIALVGGCAAMSYIVLPLTLGNVHVRGYQPNLTHPPAADLRLDTCATSGARSTASGRVVNASSLTSDYIIVLSFSGVASPPDGTTALAAVPPGAEQTWRVSGPAEAGLGCVPLVSRYSTRSVADNCSVFKQGTTSTDQSLAAQIMGESAAWGRGFAQLCLLHSAPPANRGASPINLRPF